MRSLLRVPFLILISLLVFLGCTDSSSDDEEIFLSTCTSSSSATGDRVFLACGTVNGSMVSIDIFGAEISDEFDGYNLLIDFAPSAFRYVGYVESANPFTPACGSAELLCLDNGNDANSSGQVVYSVNLTGSNPTGVTIPGQALLGTLMFEAAAASTSSAVFNSPVTTAGCVGPGTSGTTLTEADITCIATGLATIGGITWDNATLFMGATSP